ncbi:lipopolysaccharide heptosyltransferase II [Candidatus Profftia sp. (ex Adelges kitamiensis)]|uniref:lipopolysaccharide heptosyltransferase II n=1 Tax=Candidatus Profftia sp. (ex Adelges kitamiensis) TaxID=2864218 RepID=UPI001CE2D3F6|nr:lipopolysaccharide heptosyltransferase II [Candidatus Profftia sp. (ex Adelges kitamiensis)]
MKILVIGPSWIGDMIMSHSLYRTLKDINPNAEIDVMAPDWCHALLTYMPEVNQAIEMHIEHKKLAINERYRLGKSLRQKKYDRAYILPNSFKSALIPFFARIPFRVGWKGEMRYGILTHVHYQINKNSFPLMVERYIALAYPSHLIKTAEDLSKPLLWPILKVMDKDIIKTMDTFNLTSHRLMIGLCPGAALGIAKCWPHYHYTVVAQKMIKNGYYIALFGSYQDNNIGTNIYYALTKYERKYCSNFIGKTNLEQVIILIAACKAIVTNDSGLMHIAAALNKPVVALYGPTNPYFTPPLCKKSIIIHLSTSNIKIRKRNSNYNDYHSTLVDIHPDIVIQALKELLLKDD